MSKPSQADFAEWSRELAIACDREGHIVYADERAQRRLAARVGAPLTALAAPGGADALHALLRRAAAGHVEELPIQLVVDGAATALTASGGPGEGGRTLLLLRLSDHDARVQRNAALEAELARRTGELAQLTQELMESNRGVLALYQELDEKADSLRRTSEVKSRVVSNVSHEFRTPLNSILGLTRLLLARTDGPLAPEQEKQLGFILRSATELSELINDLLDLSKMEAGKIRLHAVRFVVSDLFTALRGLARPLQTRPQVELVFEDASALPLLDTDEGKIAQVLRNLISNALKFTTEGQVRVSAQALDGGLMAFRVQDSGVGIDPADHDRIFEEFTQLENPLQKGVKGTGLGLSLSRRLAELLGGTLTVESQLGAGATFELRVPIVHPEVDELTRLQQRAQDGDPARAPVLVVEDDRQTLFLYEKYLSGSGFQVVPARTIEDARALLEKMTPAAIVLDIMLEGETSWSFLGQLKSDARTRDIPILVVTVTDRENKARALGADEFWMKPLEKDWLTRKLQLLARRGPVERVLVIDDDEVSRYLVRRLLADTPYQVTEATGGLEGVRLARKLAPSVILLDFVMPGMSAFEVLDELKADPRTRNVPVIIHTSKDLAADERERLKAATAAILNKQSLSREVAIARIRDALKKAGVGTGPGEHEGGTHG
jgi:signal transduction histidine kinase/CheY-like chemotaxis protein